MRQSTLAPPGSRSRRRRITQRQTTPNQQTPLWRSPLLWLGIALIIIIGAIPIIEWYRTVQVIAILASDVSQSALADPTIGYHICRNQTQSLKPNDIAIDLFFADTTEPTRSSAVENVTQLFARCNVFKSNQPHPNTVGQGTGTSPIVLMDRILCQIDIQRTAGNDYPIAAIIWLQAAEPGPGLPALDFTILGSQINQITKQKGHVTIIGPTGTLRQELDDLSAQNPNLRICSVAEHQSCIRQTFERARQTQS
ncbi:MAG: hypothetical protein VKJ64_21555 [Leptolyngbyaceae bacterium]|nr:hypothetical protein [Leptolyngbyaceae bacterium]